jgi:hypothetical protein
VKGREITITALAGMRQAIWLLVGGLAVVLFLLLWLSPAEQTLGETVKLVYLHGALVRTALVLFAVSLPVNLGAVILVRGSWVSWGKALVWSAVAIWLVHALFSMVTTYAAWGVFIAWFEPRTRFTFSLAVVGMLVLVVSQVVGDARFNGLAYLLLAGLALGLAPRLGAIHHPLDPIGLSSSDAIRVFYAAIQVVALAIGGLVVVWLHGRIAARR